MSKLIAAINMTIDGICDHTVLSPDEEVHQHYTDLLSGAGVILYGRITYQLMQYWQPFLNEPSGNRSMDDFAVAIDKIQKIVFSRQLKKTEWDSAKLADQPLEKFEAELKQQSDKDILIGSRSLIIQLMQLDLVDEFQLCVHPVVAGNGLPLFQHMNDRTVFKLVGSKIFQGGAIILYYEPTKRDSQVETITVSAG